MRGTIEHLTSLSLEVEKIPLLKSAVDDGVAQADAAASGAHGLALRAAGSYGMMEAGVKGKEGVKSWEKKIETQASLVSAARQRWADLKQRYESNKKKLEGTFNADGTSSSQEGQTARNKLHDAEGRLSEIDELIKPCEAGILKMKSAAESMKTEFRRAESLVSEVGKADGKISADVGSLRTESYEAKTRIEALNIEPQSVQRTKAWEKISAIGDLSSDIYAAGHIVLNRTSDFSRVEESYQKADDQFEDTNKAIDKTLPSINGGLDSVESLLSQTGLP